MRDALRTADERLRARLSPLDPLLARPALLAGAAGGVAVGAMLILAAPWPAAALAFASLLGVAYWLAGSGEPVGIPVDSKPQRIRAALGFELLELPGGRFEMGTPWLTFKLFSLHRRPYADEGPVHHVAVSPFWCMTTPVTRRLYREVMGTDPGWPEGEADLRPVNNVSWHDAVAFCNALSEREGFVPCYRIEGEHVAWERDADGYRLPTEAEWEYACRAGTTTRWSFGDDEKDLERHAWYEQNSGNQPHPVATREPNPWGLYDMHGNVWEWCWDWLGPYRREAQTDPAGPESGERRALRGGAFNVRAEILRSALRDWVQPELRDQNIGFRCVRAARRQS